MTEGTAIPCEQCDGTGWIPDDPSCCTTFDPACDCSASGCPACLGGGHIIRTDQQLMVTDWEDMGVHRDPGARPVGAGDPIDIDEDCPVCHDSDTPCEPRHHGCGGSGTVTVHYTATGPPSQTSCPRDTDGDGGCWAKLCDEYHREWLTPAREGEPK